MFRRAEALHGFDARAAFGFRSFALKMDRWARELEFGSDRYGSPVNA